MPKTVPCRVCSSSDYLPYAEAGDYRIVECRECGFWFVNPQPTSEELRQIYAAYDEGIQWREKEAYFNRGVRNAILRLKRCGSLLDIGSGSGNFLLCMRKAGFSVFGIEPSESGCEYARTVHGIETFHGMIEDYQATERCRTFDVVTVLNVLEHLADPQRALLQLRQLMKPDAILAVVVPDARFHALFGRIRSRLGISDPYWFSRSKSPICAFKPPHHLSSFEPHTISMLLSRCGFGVVRIGNAPVILNPELYRNVAKLLIRYGGQLLYYASLRRYTFGYSTLVLARRQED